MVSRHADDSTSHCACREWLRRYVNRECSRFIYASAHGGATARAIFGRPTHRSEFDDEKPRLP